VLEVSEGPIQSLFNFYINGAFVGFEHQNLRLGELGQPPTFFSPNFNSYSGTAHGYGRIQGIFATSRPRNLSASIQGYGLRDIRVYSDPDTFTEQYTTSPTWCVADMLTRKRCAYGEDYARYNKQSMIDCAAWHDETVAFHDPNGNLFTWDSLNLQRRSGRARHLAADLRRLRSLTDGCALHVGRRETFLSAQERDD
jgi:hypothetical protein